jgi:GTP cyclohydrolase I
MIKQAGFNELVMIHNILYKACDDGLLTIYGSSWITFVKHKLSSNS